jgi:hypothetical protein
MPSYFSSVAGVLTWSHDDLTSHTADPLLASAVNHLRKRMKNHLLQVVIWPQINPALKADTDAALTVIDLCKVSVGGKHHLMVAVQEEMQYRAQLLNSGGYR